MKLYFYGAAQIVTGSNFLLEVGNKKILIDCGMFQGPRNIEKKNYEKFPYDPKEIDYLLITHAHLDHIGRVPKLYKDGFRGKILATKPTKDFAWVMLEDSQGILEKKAKRSRKKPLYSIKDVTESTKHITCKQNDKKIKLNKEIY